MRAIGLIGYQNSGKTSAGIKIASELKNRGYTVSAVKHVHGNLEYADKDTAQFSLYCEKVIGLSHDEVFTMEKRAASLQNILLSLETDFAIVEGFKDAKTFPKIICDQPGEKLFHHALALAHLQMNDMDEKRISWLCDLIEEKAFFLAGADCKKCGFQTCLEYAEAIINGKTQGTECLSVPEDIHLTIDGEEFPMHPFVGNTLKGTILGFIRNLKGYKEGKVTIKIS